MMINNRHEEREMFLSSGDSSTSGLLFLNWASMGAETGSWVRRGLFLMEYAFIC